MLKQWSGVVKWSISSLLFATTAGTLVTSRIGPTLVPNAQTVAWSGQMVNIVTALRHVHDI